MHPEVCCVLWQASLLRRTAPCVLFHGRNGTESVENITQWDTAGMRLMKQHCTKNTGHLEHTAARRLATPVSSVGKAKFQGQKP